MCIKIYGYKLYNFYALLFSSAFIKIFYIHVRKHFRDDLILQFFLTKK